MSEHCKHIYSNDHEWCDQPATPDSDYCVWHNPQLDKSDAYVSQLLSNVLDMIHGDLTEYQLAELDWPGATLSHMVLDGANLRDAHMPRAELVEASLRNANLRRCNLRKANLHGANLSGCDLKHTDLGGADLSEANLSHAQLSDTNLMGANLSGANLANINVQSFRWNDRTNFDDVQGLDAQDDASDETQVYLTPVALANYKKSQSSSVTHRDQVLTHEYRNASSTLSDDALLKAAGELKTQSIERRKSEQNLPPVAAPVAAAPAPRLRFPQKLLVVLSAASILIAVAAVAFGWWSFQKLQERPVITKEVIVTKEVPVEVPGLQQDIDVKASDEYKRLEQQHKQLMADNAQVREAYRAVDIKLKAFEQQALDQDMELTRLRLRNDAVELKLHDYQQLQQRYATLKRQTSRLKDTASILAKGVDRLSDENDKLNELKNKRLNTQSQLELLQTKSLQLQHDNDRMSKELVEVREQNQNLLAELTSARKSLERFLSRIEGSRLHAFLTNDASQLKAIPVQPGKPIVLSGDNLITLEISAAKKDNYIHSKLFVQRGAQHQMPDVNVIYYNADMEALRSISYGFPVTNHKDNFAVSDAEFNSPAFPSFVRILVNPGVENELLAKNKRF